MAALVNGGLPRCAVRAAMAMSSGLEPNCTVAICGHTHIAAAHADQPIPYFNSGCWTERPCHYLTVKDGVVELHKYQPAVENKEHISVPALVRA